MANPKESGYQVVLQLLMSLTTQQQDVSNRQSIRLANATKALLQKAWLYSRLLELKEQVTQLTSTSPSSGAETTSTTKGGDHEALATATLVSLYVRIILIF